MRHFSETIDIARPLEDVWRAIGTPERWFDGYVETRSRAADCPGRTRAMTTCTGRVGRSRSMRG
jgi:hypothetical protein